MGERIVNLKDLFLRIALRWRLICCWMLGCGVAFGIIGLIQFLAAKAGIQQIFVKMVMGLILGALIACGCVLIRYLSSATLCAKEDLQSMFGLNVLGSLTPKRTNGKSGIDRWILTHIFPANASETVLPEGERMRIFCTDIAIMAQKGNVRRLFITGSCGGKLAAQVKKLLCESLNGSIPEVSCGDPAIKAPEALCKLAEADAVVLVEQVDVSFYEDIRREVEYCKRYQTAIIGGIVVER